MGRRRMRMDNNTPSSIRESYDRLAVAYARCFFNELQSKPLDRELLNRSKNSWRSRNTLRLKNGN
jgi:hypothetical protein